MWKVACCMNWPADSGTYRSCASCWKESSLAVGTLRILRSNRTFLALVKSGSGSAAGGSAAPIAAPPKPCSRLMRANSRRFFGLRGHFALDQNKSPPALQLGLCEFELRISLGKSDHEWFLIH